MFQNRFCGTQDGAHLTFGFSAAPPVQSLEHFPVEGPQIAAVPDQAVGEGAVGVFREHRCGAAAGCCRQVRQTAHAHGIQALPQQQAVAQSRAAVGIGPEDPVFPSEVSGAAQVAWVKPQTGFGFLAHTEAGN